MRWLMGYSWPGNFRELQNIIDRAVVLSSGIVLSLPPDVGAAACETERVEPPSVASFARTTLTPEGSSLEEMERRHIQTVLTQTQWTIEGEHGAARALDLNPSTLRSRMKRLGINRPGRTA